MKSPAVVIRYEHNYCLAQRCRSKNFYSELAADLSAIVPAGDAHVIGTSAAALSLDFCTMMMDATNQEALDKSKAHLHVCVTLALASTEIMESSGITEPTEEHEHVRHTRGPSWNCSGIARHCVPAIMEHF